MAASWVARQRSGTASTPAYQVYVPALLFLACLAAQLYLVFYKSFNWDEFLHFGQVYQLRAGTLIQPLQVLHSRILWWAPEVSADLLEQMRAARIFIWGMHLLTLCMIYGVARQFTGAANSFFAAFAYLGAGYVFSHSFSIRADPLAAATLMSALYLLAVGRLNLTKAIAVGALIGLAGMITMKSVFYAPCFAGLLWLKLREAPEKAQFVGKLAALALAALLSFGAIYLYHKAGIVEVAKPLRNTSFVSHYLRWITIDLPFAYYIRAEFMFAPLFFLLAAASPFAWKRAGLKADAKLALAGFLAPLAVMLFYRNTFPYFFTFILAPVAVAIAPALGLVRDRYGNAFLSLLIAVAPLTLTVIEPKDVIERQQAMIDYVHREFPEKTGYLDYSGMIADYPRILKHLISGNGIRTYNERGEAVVAREIDRGNVPFIIANNDVLQATLAGDPVPGTFLPADLEAIRGNYVRQWGALWREGKAIPAGTDAFEFRVRHGGAFVVDGGPLTIDGVTVTHGMKVELSEGSHLAGGKRDASSTLWRGDRLPSAPPAIAADSLFTTF